MKTLVVYYSKSGNNKYLAEKIASDLGGDIEALRPRVRVLPLQMLFVLFGFGPGNDSLEHTVAEYDRIIVCGPIWAGHLDWASRSFLKNHGKNARVIFYATCCGGGDEEKDGKFGYAKVFREVEKLSGEKCAACEAFPVPLTLPEGKRKDDNAVMSARLSDETFSGEIRERYDSFLQTVTRV
jgi:menaquinone-dependent protoporphyrinogen IX oxidase